MAKRSKCQAWDCESIETSRYQIIDKLANPSKQKIQNLTLCARHFDIKSIETQKKGFVLLPFGEW